jgi:hypothetical protein
MMSKVTEILEILERRGAFKYQDHWILDTMAGPLHIHIYETWIACHFECPEAAKRKLPNDTRLNRFSGEWNLDISDISLSFFEDALYNLRKQ